MRRRDFLKNISMAGVGSLFLNGLPINALANTGSLQQLAAGSTNDKVLVLIQLHGGNDGLNTLIPLNQYSKYFNLRSNIAIKDVGARKYMRLDSRLPDSSQIGLHPDMASFKNMYDGGKAAIVQAVAYDNMNGSHFRSRDVWFMGGDYDANVESGWMGRYLNNVYPGFPDQYPSKTIQDPLAVEIGSKVSLAFHRGDGIPMAMALNDPAKFYDLVSQVGANPISDTINGFYGQELGYIMGVEEQSNQYASRLKQVFDKGRNSSVVYPAKYPHTAPASAKDNHLSAQLKTIARLLSGGSQTKIFLARIGGFDTHAEQTNANDPSMGVHAALLYNLFAAVNAFQEDLRGLGLEDKVMTVTFSEFGRRPESNGSFGTDHGTAAPMFVFGKHVVPGVIGVNPDLSDLTPGKNLKHQYDYRQVFATLLQDWLGAPSNAIQAAHFSDFVTNGKKLPLVAGQGSAGDSDRVGSDDPANAPYFLYDCYPNPATNHIKVKYRIPGDQAVTIKITDSQGSPVRVVQKNHLYAGVHEVKIMLDGIPNGTYFYTVAAGTFKSTKRFLKAM